MAHLLMGNSQIEALHSGTAQPLVCHVQVEAEQDLIDCIFSHDANVATHTYGYWKILEKSCAGGLSDIQR